MSVHRPGSLPEQHHANDGAPAHLALGILTHRLKHSLIMDFKTLRERYGAANSPRVQ